MSNSQEVSVEIPSQQLEVNEFEGRTAHYKHCMEELHALIKGRTPIIWVVTHEESRFISDFSDTLAKQMSRDVWLWSSYQGLVRQGQENAIQRAGGDEKDTWNPQIALKRIYDMQAPDKTKGMVYVLRDFHTVLGEPIPRQMRDMYDHLMAKQKTLIITAPLLANGPGGTKPGLPATLEKQIQVVYFNLPTKTEIENRLREIVSFKKSHGKSKKSQLNYSEEQFNTFTRALQGLTLIEVENALATSFAHLGKIDSEKLIHDKRQIIRKSEILEFVDTSINLDDVGGLDLAKEYLSKYAKANTKEARDFGVEPLKGILLTGVPGTGKSLLAKAIGKLWEVPLLRLDVGKVMTGLVGGSEGKMRDVINQAESMAPAILWIDEVEKSLAGTKSSNFSDGGTLARVFGTLLTAMQDGMEGVTIVATANDITMLPPEFIRRFNEVFFVDLPVPDERWEILGIHLKKRGRDIGNFSKQKESILKACHDYTGAELEKAVKDAIAAAYYAHDKEVSAKHLLSALEDTKPIAKIMKDKVQKIREKAKGHYRFSSRAAEERLNGILTASGKTLNVESALDDMTEVKSTKKQSQEITESSDHRFTSDDDLV